MALHGPNLAPKTASTWPQASTAAILARKLALTENSVFYRVVWPFWASSCPVGASSTLSTCLQHRQTRLQLGPNIAPANMAQPGPTWPTMAQHSPNMPTCPQDVLVGRKPKSLAMPRHCRSLQVAAALQIGCGFCRRPPTKSFTLVVLSRF